MGAADHPQLPGSPYPHFCGGGALFPGEAVMAQAGSGHLHARVQLESGLDTVPTVRKPAKCLLPAQQPVDSSPALTEPQDAAIALDTHS